MILNDRPEATEIEEGREAVCDSCHLVYWIAAPHVWEG